MIIELEWGPTGLRALAERCPAIVIVDVLSFSTSVSVAVSRGAVVWPHNGSERAEELARAIGATLVRGRNNREGRTLSPASLLDVGPGDRLVMPSLNGSALSTGSLMGGLTVVAGSLRNSRAVADWLAPRFDHVGLVPSGEQWADGSLRVAYEDLVGAGAIAARLLAQDAGVALSPGRLLQQTLVTSGTMTNRIDRLEAQGLVTRRTDPTDRRGVLVRLTDIGRAKVDAALSDLLARERQILASLRPEQRAQLAALLRTIVAPFDQAT